jgi:NADH:ubiquinone oxidoreductase subunit K
MYTPIRYGLIKLRGGVLTRTLPFSVIFTSYIMDRKVTIIFMEVFIMINSEKMKSISSEHHYSELEAFESLAQVEMAITETRTSITNLIEHYREFHLDIRTQEEFESCIDDIYRYAIEMEYKASIIRKLADYYLSNVDENADHYKMWTELGDLKTAVYRVIKLTESEDNLSR